MEWLESIRNSISYIEENLLTISSAEEVAKEVYLSPYYFQNGFKVMTGYSVSEYIRNRRLYLAALDVIADKTKLIDISFKYGYDTPESFTKAFSRFHSVTPTQLRANPSKLKVFLPLKITIVIQGGNEMNFEIEKMKNFQVIGYEREFTFDNAYHEIPKFWDEICAEKMAPLFNKEKPKNPEEETICSCCIGKYGVNIDDIGNGKFRYLIAGDYTQGDIPDGMKIFEFPEMEWAKFLCKGPMPGALQAVNTKIFNEWLPNNTEYEIAFPASIEWYSESTDMQSADYESAIWIPIKKK